MSLTTEAAAGAHDTSCAVRTAFVPRPRHVISLNYGRCMEYLQRTQAQIDYRLSELKYTARNGEEIDNDLELIALLGDRRDWTNLLKEQEKFVERGA